MDYNEENYINEDSEVLEEIEDRLEESEDTNFDFLWKEWHTLFNDYVWNNDLYQKLLLHVLLGQLFKNISIVKGRIEEDGRISIMLIQQQGTAKNTPFKPFEEICKHIDELLITLNTKDDDDKIQVKKRMRTCRLDEFSDAATIGTVRKDDEGVVDYTKGKFHKDKSDIILIKEGRKILSSQKTGKSDIVQYMNLAMDSIYMGNTIEKSLVGGDIKCPTEISLIITSFKTRMIDFEILNSGLFRRFLVYFNDMGLNEMFENLLEGNKKVLKSSKDIENSEKKGIDRQEGIASLLEQAFVNLSDNIKIQLRIDDDVSIITEEFIKKYQKICKEALTKEVGEILYSLIDSYINHARVIAAHRAIINKISLISEQRLKSNDLIIRKEDIKYALDIIDILLQNAIKLIEWIFDTNLNYYQHIEYKSDKNIRKLIMSMLADNKYHASKSIIENYLKYATNSNLTKDKNKVYECLNELIEYKIINRFGDKKTGFSYKLI
jgi:hypothetical protein